MNIHKKNSPVNSINRKWIVFGIIIWFLIIFYFMSTPHLSVSSSHARYYVNSNDNELHKVLPQIPETSSDQTFEETPVINANPNTVDINANPKKYYPQPETHVIQTITNKDDINSNPKKYYPQPTLPSDNNFLKNRNIDKNIHIPDIHNDQLNPTSSFDLPPNLYSNPNLENNISPNDFISPPPNLPGLKTDTIEVPLPSITVPSVDIKDISPLDSLESTSHSSSHSAPANLKTSNNFICNFPIYQCPCPSKNVVELYPDRNFPSSSLSSPFLSIDPTLNIIAGVTSAPENFQRRALIRMTWLRQSLCGGVGSVSDPYENMRWKIIFVVPPSPKKNINDLIEKEALIFQDVVQFSSLNPQSRGNSGDYLKIYHNTISWMKHVNNLRKDLPYEQQKNGYWFKIDDDDMVLWDNIMFNISKIDLTVNPYVYWGRMDWIARAFRGKPYASGSLYGISFSLLDKMIDIVQTKQGMTGLVTWAEDLVTAGLVQKVFKNGNDVLIYNTRDNMRWTPDYPMPDAPWMWTHWVGKKEQWPEQWNQVLLYRQQNAISNNESNLLTRCWDECHLT